MRVVLLAAALLLAPLLSGCLDPDQARYRALLREDTWEPGTTTLGGTVKHVEMRDFDTGPMQEVQLKGGTYEKGACAGFLLPPTPVVHVGDRVKIDVRLHRGTFNGVPAVWSDEMPCPGPGYAHSIAETLEAVSKVAGGAFVVLGPVSGGADYEYAAVDEAGIPMAGRMLRLSSWVPDGPLDGPDQWTHASADLFVHVSNAAKGPGMGAEVPASPHFTTIDELALAGPPGQHLAFEDRGVIGRLDNGDRLRVTGLSDGIHLLQLTPCHQTCPVLAQAFVSAGSLAFNPPSIMLTLRHEETDTGARVHVVAAQGPDVEVANLTWTLAGVGQHLRGSLTDGMLADASGRIVYEDAGRLGFVDAGDAVRVSTIANGTVSLDAQDPQRNRFLFAHQWVPGVGRPPVDLVWWMEWSGATGTVTASGPEDLRTLEDIHFGWWGHDAPLFDGRQDTCGGRTFTFRDVDADGHLSTGDRLEAAGTADDWCTISLTGFNGLLVAEVRFTPEGVVDGISEDDVGPGNNPILDS